MRTTIKKQGNSTSIRIPATILRATHLELHQIVDVRTENGCIIIEPVQPPAFDLESLISEITSQNIHKEIYFGMPVGKETW